MKVLLVGEYRPLLKALEQALVEEGHRARAAAPGDLSGAVMAVASDVVIIDLTHRGTSDLASLRRDGPKPRILVLSTEPRPEGELPGPADDWLTKPFGLEDLFRRLAELTGPG